MGKRNLIIGGFSGYSYNQIKPWVLSIDLNARDCDKVVVVGTTDNDTRTKLLDMGWKIEELPKVKAPIHVARFLGIYEYLRERQDEYGWVVTTDVRDVVFQANPFPWLDAMHAAKPFELIAGSESIRYRDEPWGNYNLLEAYGPFVHERFKDNIIYNVGTLGGTAEYLKDLVFQLFFNGINRPIPVVDQAVYNVLLQTQPYKGATFFASQADGWACQAGTTVDPKKIADFRPKLTEAEPYWKDGAAYASTGKPFVLVHQYDRVPEWQQYYKKLYGQS